MLCETLEYDAHLLSWSWKRRPQQILKDSVHCEQTANKSRDETVNRKRILISRYEKFGHAKTLEMLCQRDGSHTRTRCKKI